MTAPTTDTERRIEIARGWRSSGLSQRSYAEQHGISDRTLREWLTRYAPTTPPDIENVRRVIEDALRDLQTLLAGLEPGDVQQAVQRREPATNEPQERPTLPAPPECRVEPPEEHEANSPCQREGQLEPSHEQPKRRGNFFADAG